MFAHKTRIVPSKIPVVPLCTEITNALVLKEFTEIRQYTYIASDRQPDSDWLHGSGHEQVLSLNFTRGFIQSEVLKDVALFLWLVLLCHCSCLGFILKRAYLMVANYCSTVRLNTLILSVKWNEVYLLLFDFASICWVSSLLKLPWTPTPKSRLLLLLCHNFTKLLLHAIFYGYYVYMSHALTCLNCLCILNV